MKILKQFRQLLLGAVFSIAFFAISVTGRAEETPGLAVRFTLLGNEGSSAVDVLERLQLYVPSGEAATPYLETGPFKAEITGDISVPVRSRYAFHMVSGGHAVLEVNGEVAVESENGETIGERLRLDKGPNAIKLTLTSPEVGDTFVRVAVQSRQDPPLPIAPVDLSHDSETEGSSGAHAILRGRGLFLENRCFQCHETGSVGVNPELERDAPAFAGIGNRLGTDWMAQWILDPQSIRSSASMPRVFHGETAGEDARAIAAFLGTQVGEGFAAGTGDALHGGELFETLRCGLCHQTPSAESDATKISLAHVGAKFQPGALAAFLVEPEKHYAWSRMPNFGLSAEDAGDVAAFLGGDAIASTTDNGDDSLIARGRQLVQSTRCLNCHGSEIENKHRAPGLLSLRGKDWDAGCAGENPASNRPSYSLDTEERAALKSFVDSGSDGVGHFVAREFAGRESKSLKCASCHGEIEVIPAFELIGGKIKPEWMEKILGGTLPYDTRPLMAARMPAFKSRAGQLARGLAQGHGHAPRTAAPSEPIDEAMAEIGRTLVSAEGGFSCVSCHGVGSMPAAQIFEVESAGVNFAHSFDRLQPEYYHRWVLSPIAVDARSKMPAFFYNGQSPLPDVLEGSADKQLNAIWEYLRHGEDIKPPAQP